MSISKDTIICTIIVVIALMASFYLGSFSDSSVTTPEATKVVKKERKLRQDKELVALFQQQGLPTDGLELIYGPNPLAIGSFGSFHGPNYIYLDKSAPENRRAHTIAHEYLHYIQTKDDSYKAFNNELIALYFTNNRLYEEMGFYRNSTDCAKLCDKIIHELMPHGCTVVDDKLLNKTLLDWCNQYLPKRSELVKYITE